VAASADKLGSSLCSGRPIPAVALFNRWPYNMEGIDIYRLIWMCAVVVAAWCVQVVGLSDFSREAKNGPPKMNIVDFDKDFSGEDRARPLAELGYDMSAPFVSADLAAERIKEHQRKKWLSLLVGILGASGTFLAAYKLWDDWIAGIACVLYSRASGFVKSEELEIERQQAFQFRLQRPA
jgi:hypothetical protein